MHLTVLSYNVSLQMLPVFVVKIRPPFQGYCIAGGGGVSCQVTGSSSGSCPSVENCHLIYHYQCNVVLPPDTSRTPYRSKPTATCLSRRARRLAIVRLCFDALMLWSKSGRRSCVFHLIAFLARWRGSLSCVCSLIWDVMWGLNASRPGWFFYLTHVALFLLQ